MYRPIVTVRIPTIAISGDHRVVMVMGVIGRRGGQAWRVGLAPHAVAIELDAVSVMDEAVEDGVGIGRIADGVMPGGRAAPF